MVDFGTRSASESVYNYRNPSCKTLFRVKNLWKQCFVNFFLEITLVNTVEEVLFITNTTIIRSNMGISVRTQASDSMFNLPKY